MKLNASYTGRVIFGIAPVLIILFNNVLYANSKQANSTLFGTSTDLQIFYWPHAIINNTYILATNADQVKVLNLQTTQCEFTYHKKEGRKIQQYILSPDSCNLLITTGTDKGILKSVENDSGFIIQEMWDWRHNKLLWEKNYGTTCGSNFYIEFSPAGNFVFFQPFAHTRYTKYINQSATGEKIYFIIHNNPFWMFTQNDKELLIDLGDDSLSSFSMPHKTVKFKLGFRSVYSYDVEMREITVIPTESEKEHVLLQKFDFNTGVLKNRLEIQIDSSFDPGTCGIISFKKFLDVYKDFKANTYVSKDESSRRLMLPGKSPITDIYLSAKTIYLF